MSSQNRNPVFDAVDDKAEGITLHSVENAVAVDSSPVDCPNGPPDSECHGSDDSICDRFGQARDSVTLGKSDRQIGLSSPLKRGTYRGLLRHQLIILMCFGVAAVILGISCVDLTLLINRPAVITNQFHISYPPAMAELPPNLALLNVHDGSKFFDGLRAVTESTWDSDKIGFVDTSGKLAIKPQFSAVEEFHGGFAAAKPWRKKENRGKDDGAGSHKSREDPWGVIDKSGKFVIPPKFQSPPEFDDGIAAVLLEGDAHVDTEGGLIDPSGHFVFRMKMPSPPRKHGDVYVVGETFGKCGLVNKKGEWVVKPRYDQIRSFGNDGWSFYSQLFGYVKEDSGDDPYLLAGVDGLVGIIDHSGNSIVPAQFKGISSFHNDHATIAKAGNYGFADKSGKVIIEQRYDMVSAFDDLIAVREGNKWKVIDRSGKTVPVKMDFPIFGGGGQKWFSDGLAPIVLNGQCG